MIINPRAVAVMGVGYAPITLATDGFIIIDISLPVMACTSHITGRLKVTNTRAAYLFWSNIWKTRHRFILPRGK